MKQESKSGKDEDIRVEVVSKAEEVIDDVLRYYSNRGIVVLVSFLFFLIMLGPPAGYVFLVSLQLGGKVIASIFVLVVGIFAIRWYQKRSIRPPKVVSKLTSANDLALQHARSRLKSISTVDQGSEAGYRKSTLSNLGEWQDFLRIETTSLKVVEYDLAWRETTQYKNSNGSVAQTRTLHFQMAGVLLYAVASSQEKTLLHISQLGGRGKGSELNDHARSALDRLEWRALLESYVKVLSVPVTDRKIKLERGRQGVSYLGD